MTIDEYIESRLKRLVGTYSIYKNKDSYLHVSHRCPIYVDLDLWEFVKTVEK